MILNTKTFAGFDGSSKVKLRNCRKKTKYLSRNCHTAFIALVSRVDHQTDGATNQKNAYLAGRAAVQRSRLQERCRSDISTTAKRTGSWSRRYEGMQRTLEK